MYRNLPGKIGGAPESGGRMSLRMIAAVLLAALSIASVSAQTNSSARNRAETIFDATRAAVSHLDDPPFVAFTLQDDGHSDNGVQEERLRLLVRASDGAAVVIPLKRQDGVDIAHPSPLVIHGASYGSLTYISRVGDFTLYGFGLRYGTPTRPGIFDAPGTPEPEGTPIKSIAVVRAYDPGYRIVDLGDTTIGDRSLYHLGLTPVRDPGHHVLRELWIDRATSLPVRYLAEIPVHYPDSGQVVEHAATIDTALLDGHLTNTKVNGRFRIVVGPAETDGVVKWSVSQVSFPASEPDWVFDLKQWPKHIGEAIPNLAP